MTTTLERSALGSLCTVSFEIVTFFAFSLVSTGPALTAARWVVGASGGGANYVMNRRWAFRDRTVKKRVQGLRYAAVSFTGVTLATLVFALAMREGRVDPRLAHVGSMATVWLLFTFPLMKRWVFRAA